MSPVRTSRRAVLRGAACAIGLPWLESLDPSRGRRREPRRSPAASRLVCVSPLLGMHRPSFFAERGAGGLLEPLYEAGLEGQFTTVSGLDHKGALMGVHGLAHTLYTGTTRPSISLDQRVAPVLGRATRYPSLQVCAGDSQKRPTLSFTSSGVALPAIPRPSELFVKLYGAGDRALEREAALLESGRSVLDELTGEARSLRARVGAADAERVDGYLESVREVELRLARRRDWLGRELPVPPSGFALPEEESTDGALLLVNEELIWDLLALALQSDATRVLTFSIPLTLRALLLDGKLTSAGYHALTHHGNDPARLAELLSVERRHAEGAARFLRALANTPDGEDRSLLDSTVVLFGSAVGDAATHERRNFPLLVAGGGFRHRGHLACGGVDAPNDMACDLFVSALHRLGFDDARFGSSAGHLDGLLT